ncbi:class I SAM-dependent methyltransferase [Amycolatopsis circi]|uniref:class I SAM-dependent methyltransferase n=1 Tax=Amycolatopsis circi TaxID=871959 RepID=UPI000E2854B7|nr:class I SAM-dependent methyltransferase [Amycolatopsis circi]
MVEQAAEQSEQELEEFVRRALESYYRDGPPWDTGITPPELVETVAELPAGRALELGCGTGTNAVYLAGNGWEVVGVDLIESAVRQARAKADEAGVAARLLHGDVTRLDELAVGDGFSLVFDLSCFCGIPPHRRDAYAAGVTRAAAPGARLLMFGYGMEAFNDGIFGMTADELRSRFPGWDLTDITPGTNPFPTYWFTLRRR